jgi:hypothetical protein
MAIPSEMGAARRIAELRKTEQSAALQSSSRAAPQRGARQGHDLRGASEAQTAHDVEGLSDRDLDEILDEIVDATIRLSRAQQVDRRGVGAWRRFLSALGERLWRRESESAGSQDQ